MQDAPGRSPRSLQDRLIFGLIGLIALITIVVLLQRPFEWRMAMGASGFLLGTIGWAGMYFRLKRELPDHPLARAQRVQVRWGYRSRAKGQRLLWRLVRFHFERHRFDLWSMLMIAGLMLMLVSIAVIAGGAQAAAGAMSLHVGE